MIRRHERRQQDMATRNRLSAFRVPAIAASALMLVSAQAAAFQQVTIATRFQHDPHSGIECVDCHVSGRATTPAAGSWCADCHHESATISQCDQCHVPSEVTPEPARALVTFDLSVADAVTRSLTFDHVRHEAISCADCHVGGGPRLGVRRDCASCHVEHHVAELDCTACHVEPPVTAHEPEMHQALTGCGAAGCHVSEGLDYATLVGDRNLCIACHVAQRDHEPAEPCANCHILGGDEDPHRGGGG